MFPFCHLTLSQAKPRLSTYPAELKTIGDHICKRRLDLGLERKDVAVLLGVAAHTVKGWEKNCWKPHLRTLPKVIEFLGYDPRPEPTCIIDRLTHVRQSLGISQPELARTLGVHLSTLNDWEVGKRKPLKMHADAIKDFLETHGQMFEVFKKTPP